MADWMLLLLLTVLGMNQWVGACQHFFSGVESTGRENEEFGVLFGKVN